MAPGAKKNPKAKSKKALSVDFKKVKSKVGRKLAPPQNATKVEFKAKGIVIPGQSVAQDKDGLAVNQRKQTLKELLVQTTHYNERVRKDALMGLKDLFGKHPKELVMHAVAVIEKLSSRVTDTEKSVRQALVLLLRTSVLPNLPKAMMKPLVPVLMAHICSAMTHMILDIRVAACSFSDLLVQHCPNLVVPLFSGQIVQHYVSLLGKGGISGQPGSRLASILISLEHLLSALKQNTRVQPSGGSAASNLTHKWSLKPKTTSEDGIKIFQALHGYRSGLREENSFTLLSAQEGGPVQSASTCTQLVPVLLECWTEYAPMVCSTPNPDISMLECMVLITRCLSHIFQTLTTETAPRSSAKDMGKTSAAIRVPEYGSEEWENRVWMQHEFLPGLNRCLLKSFPVLAPDVRLVPKIEESLVALNIGICEVMLQFILPNSEGIENRQVDVVLQYIEGALYGMMLPSSQFSEGVPGSKYGEPHVKSLIHYLPGLLMCVSADWVSRLLQAFTHVFESCSSHSNTKMVCLSSMTELVLQGSKSAERNGGKYNAVSSEFQARWLQSLPRLLWELKHSHFNVSQAVLEMLLYVGRSSLEGSPLAERFNALQQAMVPFFCTFLPSKESDETRCVYGPFTKLPMLCQELATDLLYYYTAFSPLFLKVLAQCSLCSDVDAFISVRMVEVVQRSFSKGAIGLAEHLSFLFTLLVGHTSSQGGSSTTDSFAGVTMGADGYHEDLELEKRKRQSAITGVVCACLSQIGDGNIVLVLLGSSIREELERRPSLRVMHSIWRVIAVLSRKDKLADGLFLPDSLVDLLPRSAADFLISLSRMDDGACGKELALNTLKRPCITLMGRSPSFTRRVLKVLHDYLLEDVHPSIVRRSEERLTVARVVLEMIKIEKLDRCLSPSRDMVMAIMRTIEWQANLQFPVLEILSIRRCPAEGVLLLPIQVYEDIQTSEGRDLKRLHEQLQTVTSALFGNGFLP